MGYSLDAEQGYSPTEPPLATTTRIKSLAYTLTAVIGKAISKIYQTIQEINLKYHISPLVNLLTQIMHKYQWNTFHTKLTLTLLSRMERLQFGLTYLTIPVALHVVYILYGPTPHLASAELKPVFQWILFVVALIWAIFTLIWLSVNFYYWRDRFKIKGFLFDYIYQLQTRTLFIGLYLTCLQLAFVPKAAIWSYILIGYYLIAALIASLVFLVKPEWRLWYDKDLLQETYDTSKFSISTGNALRDIYKKENPGIPLDDLSSSDRSTGSTGDAPETQSRSDGNNRTQTQSSSITNDPHVEPPPPDPNGPQAPPTGSSSGNLVNRPNLEPTDSFRLRDLQDYMDLVQSYTDFRRYLASRDSEGDSTNPH